MYVRLKRENKFFYKSRLQKKVKKQHIKTAAVSLAEIQGELKFRLT